MKWSIGAKISSGFAVGLPSLVVTGLLPHRNATKPKASN
jgi:hypothetical protein